MIVASSGINANNYFLGKEILWRLILGVGAVLGAAQSVLLLRACESPRWLAANGRQGDAEDNLHALRGRDLSMVEIEQALSDHQGGTSGKYYNNPRAPFRRILLETHSFLPHTAEAEPLISEEEEGRNATKQPKITLVEFVTAPKYHKQVIAVIGIMLIQQLTGINAIVMYGVSVLRELIPENGAALINVFISAINLFFTWYASRYFDSAGRKPYLLASIGGMGINSLALGLGIIFHIPLLSAVATVLFVSSFSIGLGPIPWMVAAETVEYSASGAAQSISLCANWIGTFLVSYGFPVLAAAGIGKGGMFLLFAGVALLGVIFVERNSPETKGKSVSEAWANHEVEVKERGWWEIFGGRGERVLRND